MRTGTAILTGFLLATAVFGVLARWFDLEPTPPSSAHAPFVAVIHTRPARPRNRPSGEAGPKPAPSPYAPMPAALTGAPPQEVWLPRVLSDADKSRRIADDTALSDQEWLRGNAMGNATLLQSELVNSKYDDIESQLDAIETLVNHQPKFEYLELDAATFAEGSGALNRSEKFLIDAWLKARPKSAWAHYAEGIRWFNAAWKARGDGWAMDVKDSAWPTFHRDIGKARAEIGVALKLDPGMVVAWSTAIDADRSDSGLEAAERDYTRSLKLHPGSLMTVSAYQEALDPHWYGSYERMDELAQQASAKADQYPYLWSTLGGSFAAKACAYCNHFDWLTGLKQYNRALAYEDEPAWLDGAGNAALHLHRYGLAYQYYSRAYKYKPSVFSYLEHTEVLQALCDPNETELKFKALVADARTYGGIAETDYPRKPGDCIYYQAELPWGDEPVPNPGDIQIYSIQVEIMKAKQRKN